MMAGLILAGLVLLLMALTFIPAFAPAIVNIIIAALVAWRLKARLAVRLGVALVVSALLSLALRLPSLVAGDPDEVRMNIGRKTLVGPSEKVRFDGPDDVFYRRESDPPTVGLRADWSFGVRPLNTVSERPKSILKNAGLGTTTGDSRVVLRIRSNESGGIMELSAEVLDAGAVVATFKQRVRRAYPLEEFDAYGKFAESDWRPVFLALTQDTFWAQRHAIAKAGSHPLDDFVRAALMQGGLAADGKLVAPLAETLEGSGKLRQVSADIAAIAIPGREIAPNQFHCERHDGQHGFTIGAVDQFIRWQEPGIPPMALAHSLVQGRYPDPLTIHCGEPANTFWFAAYREGRLNLWRYRVEFDARSSIVEQWLQHEVPPAVRERFDAMVPRRLQIAKVGESSAELYLVSLTKEKGKRVPGEGYRIEMSLR